MRPAHPHGDAEAPPTSPQTAAPGDPARTPRTCGDQRGVVGIAVHLSAPYVVGSWGGSTATLKQGQNSSHWQVFH